MELSAQTFSLLFGGFLSAISGGFVIRQWYIHRGDETTKERETREANAKLIASQERKDDLDRNEAGVRYLMDQFRAEIDRLKADVLTLRAEVAASNKRADEVERLYRAESTKNEALTRQNEAQAGELTALRGRVATLESKESADDRADARSEREQDRLDTRDDRRDERERNRT